MNLVNFFSEHADYQYISSINHEEWLIKVINEHAYELQEINYIFCDDKYLLNINQEYLNHDTYTDIITFNNAEKENTIESDIYISIDRIYENAEKLNTSFDNELSRVMVHGVLHLLGFKDKSDKDKENMRKKEEACLSLLKI